MSDVTRILSQIEAGNPAAADQLLPLVYDELKKLAAATAPLREMEPNLHVLNPLAIPAYGKPWIRTLNQRVLRYQVKRAMRKLGFRREGYSPRYLKIRGRWRDHERWAIVRESWSPARPAPPPRARKGRS